MRDGPQPVIERLLIPNLIASLGEFKEAYPAGEWQVKQMLRAGMSDPLAARAIVGQLMFADFARTAALFVLPFMDVAQACQGGDPELPELPPLPFPRVAFEAIENHCWPVGLEGDDASFEIEAGVIAEITQGYEWAVMLYVKDLENELDPEWKDVIKEHRPGTEAGSVPGKPTLMFPFSLNAKGEMRVPYGLSAPRIAVGGDGETELTWDDVLQSEPTQIVDTRIDPLRRFVLEVAHLMTARGVTTDEMPVPRAQRRSYARRQKRYAHPTVYVVKIGGETTRLPGHGDREYHVRWLQRGHWRHYAPESWQTGQRPDPERPPDSGWTVTWIGAQIRGPAGAPWKGRPVYVKEGGEA